VTKSLIVLINCLLLSATAHAQPWRRHTIDNSSRGADGVRLADVDGDGLLDITTGWEEGGVIRVYRNPGADQSKQPWPSVTVGRVNSPEDAVFADLDGDGAEDVVSCCEGKTRTVFFHWAPKEAGQAAYFDASAWQTEAVPATASQQMWMFAVPLEIDGQGGIDLVVGSKSGGATVGWLQSPADPRDVAGWRFHPLYQAGWIMSLQLRDMDGDGDMDVLASDRKTATRGVLWLENPGTDTAGRGAEWPLHRIGGEDREVMFLTSADLDQDGRVDVVCTVKDRGIAFFRNTGEAARPWQVYEIPMPAHCGTGKGVAVSDLDGDGDQDVVFSCENATNGKSGVRWLAYTGSPLTGPWQDHEISGPEGVKFDRIELMDLDNDGDQDVVTCEERDNLGVIWYENPSR